MTAVSPDQPDGGPSERTLAVVDNFDSFVHTLADYCRQLGAVVRVFRNDAVSVETLRGYDGVLLSPGPGAPDSAGVCVDAVRKLGATPVLGVCLGHQAIGAAFGGSIVRAEPTHGRASTARHTGDALFDGVPREFRVARYHSLVIAAASVPACLEVTAETADGVVMAVRHRGRPVYGVQFHPESVLSDHGGRVVANFLRMAGFAIGAATGLGVPGAAGRTDDALPSPWWLSGSGRPAAVPFTTPGRASSDKQTAGEPIAGDFYDRPAGSGPPLPPR